MKNDVKNSVKKKHPGGRPTMYTDELAQEICDVVSLSEKGLRRLCEENDHWPDKITIFRWRRDNEQFCTLFDKAKENQMEVQAEELMNIADDIDQNKTMVQVQHSKLRIETRKWTMERLKPKKYGSRTQTELTGKDGAAIETTNLTADEHRLRIAELLAAGSAQRTIQSS